MKGEILEGDTPVAAVTAEETPGEAAGMATAESAEDIHEKIQAAADTPEKAGKGEDTPVRGERAITAEAGAGVRAKAGAKRGEATLQGKGDGNVMMIEEARAGGGALAGGEIPAGADSATGAAREGTAKAALMEAASERALTATNS